MELDAGAAKLFGEIDVAVEGEWARVCAGGVAGGDAVGVGDGVGVEADGDHRSDSLCRLDKGNNDAARRLTRRRYVRGGGTSSRCAVSFPGGGGAWRPRRAWWACASSGGAWPARGARAGAA